MDYLDKAFYEELVKELSDDPENFEKAEEIIKRSIEDLSKKMKEHLSKNSKPQVKQEKANNEKFIKIHKRRYKSAFKKLNEFITICTSIGVEFNYHYRDKVTPDNDITYDTLIRLHARACLVAKEALSLLKEGYADAAHARWRSLHEISVTASFIAMCGNECAEQFYWHEIVDSYNGMKVHKAYEDRLREKGPSQSDIDSCKEDYDFLIKKYGEKFGDYYGWASHALSEKVKGKRKVTFADLEKDVGLDHLRPYYKWASQNVHSGSKGTRNRLSLVNSQTGSMLIGPASGGMTDPAHSIALSLFQVTAKLLLLENTLDNTVTVNALSELQEEVGQEFLSIEKPK